jgi:hypothetical protein
MKRSSQSPHDSVLRELASHGKMTRSILRQRIGIKKAELDIIQADLERESRITRTTGQKGLIMIKNIDRKN